LRGEAGSGERDYISAETRFNVLGAWLLPMLPVRNRISLIHQCNALEGAILAANLQLGAISVAGWQNTRGSIFEETMQARSPLIEFPATHRMAQMIPAAHPLIIRRRKINGPARLCHHT